MQFQELEEVPIAGRMAQVHFDIICPAVDLLQVPQEESCCTVEDLEEEAGLLIGIKSRYHIIDKWVEDFCFFQTYGDKEIRSQENP